jgi:2-polyprenyl-3-methyl-5-hydroxy-6-metoxy-1,4-benzoquinol methylase
MPEHQRFDDAAATWDEVPRRVEQARAVAAAIVTAMHLPDDVDVLDFGCGTGLLSLELRPLVASVTGADASAGMLAVLRRKVQERSLSGVDAVLVDATAPLALGRRFDLIVSSMALHHVADPAPLLERLHAHLRPGGRIAMADLDREDGSFHADSTGVFHLGFERAQVAAWLAAAGFADVELTTATTVRKEGREYPIFLASGRRAG